MTADKNMIKTWFTDGAERGHKHMLIVYDRMDHLDGPDSPHYCNDAEAVYEALRDYSRDPMCQVMEVYDLAADMEAQLDEHRAWRLPTLPEQDEQEAPPDRYPASGLLASGETRLQFMERKNAAFIGGRFKKDFGKLGAAANPLHLFADESREFVHHICVYILEQADATRATAAAVYCFKPDGTASAHGKLLMHAGEEASGVLLPLPQHHTVEFDLPYITFDICYAQGKDKYSPAYLHCSVAQSFILTERGLGMDTGSLGNYVDWDSHELYEEAMEILRGRDGASPEAASLLHKAAREGHGDAMYELGNYFAGREHDGEQSAYWYKRAALLGHEAAAERIK